MIAHAHLMNDATDASCGCRLLFSQHTADATHTLCWLVCRISYASVSSNTLYTPAVTFEATILLMFLDAPIFFEESDGFQVHLIEDLILGFSDLSHLEHLVHGFQCCGTHVLHLLILGLKFLLPLDLLTCQCQCQLLQSLMPSMCCIVSPSSSCRAMAEMRWREKTNV